MSDFDKAFDLLIGNGSGRKAAKDQVGKPTGITKTVAVANGYTGDVRTMPRPLKPSTERCTGTSYNAINFRLLSHFSCLTLE